jgi:hypothetical protein
MAVLPSQVVQAIEEMFGSNRSEIYSTAINQIHQVDVQTLLALLDEVPRELINLPWQEYRELKHCQANLATAPNSAAKPTWHGTQET